MVEFGAKLSLKDNMYATLQKNLKMQKEFSKQVKDTDSSIQGLGKRKANPLVTLRDNATAQLIGIKRDLRAMSNVKALTSVEVENEALTKIDEITKKINRLGKMVASPFIKIKDGVSAKVDNVKQKLKQIATTYTPIVKIRDLASNGLSKIKNTLGWLGKTAITPVIKLKDGATKVANKVRVALRVINKTVAKPFIQLKDKASPILNKVKNTLKAVGKTVAKPFVALKDGATAVLGKVKDGLKSIGSTVAKATVAIKDGATAGLSKIKNMLGTLAKGVTIGVAVAGAGLTALAGGSIGEGAKLEQSIGGVKTLFGARGAESVEEYADMVGKSVDSVRAEYNTLMKSQQMVLDNADMAYKTAGLSANAYMETVTSFSASLLQSTGKDTVKSAEIANMAIIDMADNANKFGTDMGSIQNAYQGFAKQNYTMLDNLKLGYGGTKEEMERLLVDAQKLTGVKYDITNLADVYNAIHVIQGELGVTGATADEAGTTFTGSFNAMKASAQNLLGNLAIGGDVTGSMEALVDSAFIFLVDNFIPMISNIFTALPSAISTGIKKVAPKLKEVGGSLITSLKDGIIGLLPSSMQGVANNLFGSLGSVFNSITNMLSSVAPKVAEKLGGVFGDGSGILDGITSAIDMAMPTIENLILGVADVVAVLAPILGDLGGMFMDIFPSILGVVDSVIPVIVDVVSVLGEVIQQIMPVVTQIIQTFASILQQVLPIVGSIFTSVANAVMPVVQALTNVIQACLPFIQNIVTAVSSAVQSVLPTLSQIFTEVGQKVAEIINTVVVPVIQTFQGIFEKLTPVIQPIMEAIMSLISGAWDVISPVIDLAMTAFEFLWGVIDPILNGIADLFVFVWDIIEPIVGWVSDALGVLGDAVSGISNFYGGVIDTVGGWLGFAYGKDRVPYDNYPAILHQGEKVLTRNQADQYERQMSTRGVQMPQLMEVPKAEQNSSYLEVSDNKQTSQTPVTGGANITIEKLADTVVIEKEADVDKVVEDMITKFRKLLPNMT